jgi:DNA repair protein RadC
MFVFNLHPKVLCKIRGLFFIILKLNNMNTTHPTLAEIELSYKPKKANHPIIKSSADVYLHLLRFFPEDTISLQERFVAGYVNRANRLIGVCNISTGGITGIVADPKTCIICSIKNCSNIYRISSQSSQWKFTSIKS